MRVSNVKVEVGRIWDSNEHDYFVTLTCELEIILYLVTVLLLFRLSSLLQ